MDEKKIVDQSALAESVAKSIQYEFLDHFLVKPLDPVKVKKEFSKPVSTGTPVEDANGVKAEDFDSVETEVKEVDSDYRTAVVIKLAKSYEKQLADPEQNKYLNEVINVGDIIVIRETSGLRFDLVKDSRLIRYYDIIGIVK